MSSMTLTQESPGRSTRVVAIRKRRKSDDIPCPGYKLSVPDDQVAVSSYPFAMHMARSVPWAVSVKGVDVYLHSRD
jgi:hypothetical protein